MPNLGAAVWRTTLNIKLFMLSEVCAWITVITFTKIYWILPTHSNVTIKNVSWPHFSWATLYMFHSLQRECSRWCSYSKINLYCAGSNVSIPGEVVVLNSVVLPDKELDASYKNQIILWPFTAGCFHTGLLGDVLAIGFQGGCALCNQFVVSVKFLWKVSSGWRENYINYSKQPK